MSGLNERVGDREAQSGLKLPSRVSEWPQVTRDVHIARDPRLALAVSDADAEYRPLVEYQELERGSENHESFIINGPTTEGPAVLCPDLHQTSIARRFAVSNTPYDLPPSQGTPGSSLPTFVGLAVLDPSAATIPDITNTSSALDGPNELPWDVNNMYLNNPQTMQQASFSNVIYSTDTRPPLPWTDTAHLSAFGPPAFPMPVQTPHPATFCNLCPASFTRYSDYERHWQSVHLGIKHHCFWPGCSNNRGNGYCRAEKLKTHQRRVHGLA